MGKKIKKVWLIAILAIAMMVLCSCKDEETKKEQEANKTETQVERIEHSLMFCHTRQFMELNITSGDRSLLQQI